MTALPFKRIATSQGLNPCITKFHLSMDIDRWNVIVLSEIGQLIRIVADRQLTHSLFLIHAFIYS